MSNKEVRRPFRNFFIKKSLQFKIILKILFIVFLTSIMTTLILAGVYDRISQRGSFYYMSNDIKQDLELTNILGIILPALITAQVGSLIIAILIGMFSSRKAAVPVYKLEKWAVQIKKGRLKTHLGFRETKEMKELTIQCNALADAYRYIFSVIDQSLSNIVKDPTEKSPIVMREIAKIQGIIANIDFKEDKGL